MNNIQKAKLLTWLASAENSYEAAHHAVMGAQTHTDISSGDLMDMLEQAKHEAREGKRYFKKAIKLAAKFEDGKEITEDDLDDYEKAMLSVIQNLEEAA